MNLISGVKYLVDTNILVYSLNSNAPQYTRAKELLEAGFRDGVGFVVAHQNLMEFLAVLTRAYKIEVGQAMGDVEKFISCFEVIFPLSTTLGCFSELMTGSGKGVYPFDVYLAATMLDNGVERIITANAKDFQGLGLEEVITI